MSDKNRKKHDNETLRVSVAEAFDLLCRHIATALVESNMERAKTLRGVVKSSVHGSKELLAELALHETIASSEFRQRDACAALASEASKACLTIDEHKLTVAKERFFSRILEHFGSVDEFENAHGSTNGRDALRLVHEATDALFTARRAVASERNAYKNVVNHADEHVARERLTDVLVETDRHVSRGVPRVSELFDKAVATEKSKRGLEKKVLETAGKMFNERYGSSLPPTALEMVQDYLAYRTPEGFDTSVAKRFQRLSRRIDEAAKNTDVANVDVLRETINEQLATLKRDGAERHLGSLVSSLSEIESIVEELIKYQSTKHKTRDAENDC